MNKIHALIIIVSSLFLSIANCAYSQIVTQVQKFPLVQWTANQADQVKIENGNGSRISVQITVFGNENSPGISIKNCGDTSSLKGGSSAICTNSDSANPVTFSGDNANNPAKGTYQISEM